MSSSATTGGSGKTVRDIPVWLTVPIVILCLGGGAYLLYTMFIRDDRGKPREVSVEDIKGKGIAAVGGRGAGGAGMRWRDPNATAPRGDGIVETGKRAGGSNYRVRAGTTRMEVAIDGKGAVSSLTLTYPDFLTTEQSLYLQNRRQVLDDPKMRQYAGITPEQVKKLNEMPPPDTMRATPDEKKKLGELVIKWKDAPADKKAQAEKDAVTALAEIGKARHDETKQYALARVDMVKSILTPQQIKLIRDPQRTAAPTPPAKGPGKAGKAPAKPAAEKEPAAAPTAAPTNPPAPAPAGGPTPSPTTPSAPAGTPPPAPK